MIKVFILLFVAVSSKAFATNPLHKKLSWGMTVDDFMSNPPCTIDPNYTFKGKSSVNFGCTDFKPVFPSKVRMSLSGFYFKNDKLKDIQIGINEYYGGAFEAFNLAIKEAVSKFGKAGGWSTPEEERKFDAGLIDQVRYLWLVGDTVIAIILERRNGKLHSKVQYFAAKQG